MSTAGPLVTILINNYNYGRFLRDAIDSALNQTYPNTEVIVVDDGSTDDSREIIVSYGERVIPVFKRNGGQASAVNAGFAASGGDIVCFLDSDDTWLPQKVEQVVRAAISHDAAKLIYHRIQRVDALGNHLGQPQPRSLLQGNIASTVIKSCGWWDVPPMSALSFRREYLSAVLNMPEDVYRLHADAYLETLAPLLGEVAGLGQVLSAYRLHGSNLSNYAARQRGEYDALIAHLERYATWVTAVNQALRRIGVGAQLDLADHYGYQCLKYRLGLPGRLPLATLSWKALRLPCVPSHWARFKLLLHLWLERRASYPPNNNVG
jgi:glycosyltransferase involved in cell wall biosynthesis